MTEETPHPTPSDASSVPPMGTEEAAPPDPVVPTSEREASPSDEATAPAEPAQDLDKKPGMTVLSPAVERALPAILQEMLHPEDQKLTYRITLPSFDGPMELLLHLIKEHEVDIYDIPIAIITQEYLAVLELMQQLNLDVAGDFLVMAATLMQIKSRMLLPIEPKTDGEEPEDPRAELVRRLIEYKQFKDAADRLGDMEKDRGRLLPRNVPEEWKESGEEEHLVEVTLFGLLNAFKDVLIHAQKDFATELIRPEITVTQKINDLMDLLQEQREVKFRPLLMSLKSKLEKIVTFLALLELVRLKLVKAYQAGPFDEIRLFLAENSPGAPAAGLANPDVPGMARAEKSFDDAELELRAEDEPEAEETPKKRRRRKKDVEAAEPPEGSEAEAVSAEEGAEAPAKKARKKRKKKEAPSAEATSRGGDLGVPEQEARVSEPENAAAEPETQDKEA